MTDFATPDYDWIDGQLALAAMGIEALMEVSHAIATGSGFHEDRDIEGVVRKSSFMERVALLHEEASEAGDAYRRSGFKEWTEADGKPEGVTSELADGIIRACDNAKEYGLTLPAAITQKCLYNMRRPKYHGKANL